MTEADQLVPRQLLEDMSGCDCPPACHQVVYTLHDTRSISAEDLICRTNVHLKLDLTTDLVEESLSFTPSTLVANLGGFIGLVTGYSLLTLIGMMEKLIRIIVDRLRANRTPASHDLAIAAMA
ncbi:hypothetical protein FJT64_023492 [Amphibalanus amphitrite]|uniref:Uncharacterized protein n=1 Tax=Amphibalanus amphitrite TaxID=1232801 RepID=A0A6A4WRM8_AMPAM|nr:hypothetical protein FJT64_023492 [Amphibalanus amphitrite]